MKTTKKIPALRFPEFEGEWSMKLLGDVAIFSKGKGVSKSDIDENGKFECIRYGELYTHYNELIKDVISKTNVDEKELVFSEYNDVIIPGSGETQLDIATASCVLKDGVALGGDLNIIKTKINGVFLAYYLNNAKKNDIATLAQGNSVVHLYASQLKTLSLNIPVNKEQQKIASFLTAVDDKIQRLTKKKALLERYKKGVIQQIFNQQIRFKDDNGNDYPNWEEKRLVEVLKENKKRNTDNNVEEVFSVAKSKGVINQLEHLGRSYAAEDVSNYKVAFPDDIIYTKSPTSDFPFGIIKQNKLDRKGIVSVLYAIYTPLNKHLGNIIDAYFSSWVNTYNYLSPLVRKGAKNTMNIGNDEFLKGTVILLPISVEEQEKISSFLNNLEAKIDDVNNRLEQMRQYKKGLLQQMFV